MIFDSHEKAHMLFSFSDAAVNHRERRSSGAASACVSSEWAEIRHEPLWGKDTACVEQKLGQSRTASVRCGGKQASTITSRRAGR